MKFTDIFIRRPVLASVVSLLVLLIGIGGLLGLPIRQYPKMTNTVISINTSFPGADALTIKGFITEPIQKAIATTAGINYIDSQSQAGSSSISVVMQLDADANAALTEITGKVSAIRYKLPKAAESPSIRKKTGSTFPSLILAVTTETMSPQQVTSYINRVLSPKLANVNGVAKVDVWGGDDYAMRIWLDPRRMAAFKITPKMVLSALQKSNVQGQAGQVRGQFQQIEITGGTQLDSVQGFENIVIKRDGDQLIYVRDIARVQLGSRSDASHVVLYNGKQAFFAAIQLSPEANPLTVIRHVLAKVPSIQKQLPHGMELHTLFNSTTYIANALDEVVRTLIEAVVIVVLVILLCLGSWRAILVPVLTIPLSLIGVCFFMYLLGFSLNLLTFLAMVLAIGLVVDDAIVVVENIYQYLESGDDPFTAALKGAREIAGPVVVMTLTLAAVFAPIGFVGGITGVLFQEFAFTLAGAVVISGVIALTLSPMLCAKWLSSDQMQSRFSQKIDRVFTTLTDGYQQSLTTMIRCRKWAVVLVLLLLINIVVFYVLTPKELAPQEDQGFLGAMASAPINATIDYMRQYNDAIQRIFTHFPAYQSSFIVDGHRGGNQILAGMVLKDWQLRDGSSMDLKNQLQQQLNHLPGISAFAFQPSPLPGVGGGLPIQFVLKTTLSIEELYAAVEKLKKAAERSGLFMFLQSNLTFNQPQLSMKIDRQKAADLGVSVSDVASALSVMTGNLGVGRFNLYGANYEVVPQVDPQFRGTAKQLGGINISAPGGQLIPLNSIVSYQSRNDTSVINQFQQLNAATLSGMPNVGVSMGAALDYLQHTAAKILPQLIEPDYSGESRQFKQEGHTLLVAFVFSLLIIFLLLAAQFESYRDPLIILLSVPLSLFGALLPLFLGLASINIYTQIGMITLVGLISKHGILMVSCANDLRRQGVSKGHAIVQASTRRLRPVLMTTAAIVFGVVPLLMAHGAGAVSRFDLGLVIASGMLIGTCFTLFIVPCFYIFISHKDDAHVDATL